jgi:diketogulonate reductase-like aldo/keto reductase
MTAAISRGGFLGLAAGAAIGAATGRAVAAAGAPILRAIPKSGETLPAVGLGTSLVFDGIAPEQRRAVVKALLDGGGSLIDTAPMYGVAEDATGDAVAALGARSRVFLATKVLSTGKDQGAASMEASFRKLRADVVDLMQVHNLVDTATQLATIRDWKARGRIRYVGITHFQPEAQEALAPWLEKEPLDFVQFNYSLDVRAPEKRLLPLAADKGVAVLVNLPLGRGRLLNAVKAKPLPGWAAEAGVVTWAQLLLKFVVSHPAVTVAIPATRNPSHMAENMIAARGPLLTPAQRAELVALLDKA